MLSEVAFQQIKDNYYYGAYGEFRVIIEKSNGFINATKMCKVGGKDYYDWSRLKSTHQLIQTLQMVLALENTQAQIENSTNTLGDPVPGIPGRGSLQCFKVVQGGNEDADRLIAGTYIHPDLVPSIAGWISPLFQLNANRVVNGYIMEEYRAKLAS